MQRFDLTLTAEGCLRHRMVSGQTALGAEDSHGDRDKWSYLLLADALRRRSARCLRPRAGRHRRGAAPDGAELALAELRRLGARRVGFVAPMATHHSFGAALRSGRAAAGVNVVDTNDAVDALKAIKSPEERALMRQVAALQDEVMARVRSFIHPGLKDFEVAAYAQYMRQQLGSEQGIFVCSPAAPGQAASFRPRSMQGRTLQPGDIFSLLVENKARAVVTPSCRASSYSAQMFVHDTDLSGIEVGGPGGCLHRTPKQIFEID